jgi:hypothetical protein
MRRADASLSTVFTARWSAKRESVEQMARRE